MDRLIKGYGKFRKNADLKLYEKLGKGQFPHTFVISCSDSRIVPEKIFSSEAGELFVLRNVGNLADLDDPCFLSALEYALLHLGVDNVLVLSHSECGAVKALSQRDHIDTEGLEKWFAHETYDGKNLDEAVRNNGIRQYRRILQHPLVNRAMKDRDLKVELLFFDICTLGLERFCGDKWEEIK